MNDPCRYFEPTILILVKFEFFTTFLDFFCEFIFKFVNFFRIRDFKMVLEPIFFLKNIEKNILDFTKIKRNFISFSFYIILRQLQNYIYRDIFFTNYEIFMLKIVIVAKISDESGAPKLGFRVPATNLRNKLNLKIETKIFFIIQFLSQKFSIFDDFSMFSKIYFEKIIIKYRKKLGKISENPRSFKFHSTH